MAMFFDFPVGAPNPYTPIESQWHSKYSLLAVAVKESRQGTMSGSIHLFTEDGEHLTNSTVQRVALPSTLSWHPTLKLLATGWESGEIIVWNDASQHAHDCQRAHETPIVKLTWSFDGSRLFTSDEDGKVCVWRISKTGKPTLMSEMSLNESVTHAVAVNVGAGDSSVIFVATANQQVFKLDAAGGQNLAFTTDSPLVELTHTDQTDSLVAIGTDNLVTQYKVEGQGNLSSKYEFKLPGKSVTDTDWLDDGILAIAASENGIRFWDSEEGEVVLLSLSDEQGDFSSSDIIQSVSFDSRSNIIAGSSRSGVVYMWKGKSSEPLGSSNKWKFLSPINMKGSISSVSWGPNSHLAAENTTDTVSILREHIMRKAFAQNVAAVQVSSGRLVVEVFNNTTHEVDTDLTIKGICADSETVCAWSGKSVVVFELVREGTVIRPAGKFKCDASACAVYKGTVFTAEGSKIHARNYSGNIKQTITVGADEGNVSEIVCNGSFLAACTESTALRVWDVSRREARLHAGPRAVDEAVDSVHDIGVNCTGTHISFLAAVENTPDSNVWVWDTESDVLHSQGFDVGSRTPNACYWDNTDGRLFAAETLSQDGSGERQVTTMFVTPDSGIVVQYSTPLADDDGVLVGVQVPHLMFASSAHGDHSSILFAKSLRDFVGLENADADTRRAMLDFSYQLAAGNLDEAFKAVRMIESESVWTNMARMCVTSKRLDVAQVCMGKLGNALGARALREAEKEPQLEARCGILAVQLGMGNEAERLFKSCGRHDLLNQFYQDSGMWQQAVSTARDHDRIHLRNTYYKYAQYLEALGLLNDAVKHYELAGAHVAEVPRILIDTPTELEAYIKKSKNKELLKWWAQYLESNSELERAKEYYAAAGDTLNLVRVFCFFEQVDEARALVDETKDRAAAFHLAKFFENTNSVEDAIEYYSLAESFNNAIRLAKQHGFKQKMLSLALKSSKADMISAAEYYESQGAYDKAVMLFHKGGRIGHALEMCFTHSLFLPLSEITKDLDEHTDPELLARAASFFKDNNQHDRAVGLLITAKQFDQAIDTIERHNVFITDEYATKMTYDKHEVDKAVRTALLERIADVCVSQGSYQLATKKYTQAGKHVKAMKALLKCGDTERIIFFANKCRQKEVYVMAANFLQSLDWRRDHEVMKNIIAFYTKGRALDSLAGFYEACAQVEIDEYQDYDKALGALQEALRHLSRARMKDVQRQEELVASLQNRLELTQRFVDIKSLAAEDPAEMMAQANMLLQESELDQAVRVGDVFGLIIEYLASREEYDEAYQYMQQLSQRVPGANIAFYVNMHVVEAVHKALNIPLGTGRVLANDDEIGEDIPEEEV
eukprot:m.79743 g.79743  ORF g.79743 m.79743 type:complete len:1348 (+) comp12578_c0_seq1:46-4089(+)